MLLIDLPVVRARATRPSSATAARPTSPIRRSPADLDDAEWAEYLFFRDNPKGPFAERWSHSAGCRRWFNVVRDTATYEILAVYGPASRARRRRGAVPDERPVPGVCRTGGRIDRDRAPDVHLRRRGVRRPPGDTARLGAAGQRRIRRRRVASTRPARGIMAAGVEEPNALRPDRAAPVPEPMLPAPPGRARRRARRPSLSGHGPARPDDRTTASTTSATCTLRRPGGRWRPGRAGRARSPRPRSAPGCCCVDEQPELGGALLAGRAPRRRRRPAPTGSPLRAELAAAARGARC